jgi:myo-inositol-1(or 4)-monophosphatase
MTSTNVLSELAQGALSTVRQVMDEVRPKLVAAAFSGDSGESENSRHADNFLSVHDLWMHERYQQLLSNRLGSFVYASEEAEPQVIGTDPDPDLCVLVDPLDTSELAVRGLHGYTHLMMYSRGLNRPVVAVVGDIFHHIQCYIGFRDEDGVDHARVVAANGHSATLGPAEPKVLNESLVTNYLMRPRTRFVPLSDQVDFMAALGKPGSDGQTRGRIGVDFGSVGLCHVAAGFTDAMAEFAKGFAVWDLAPGHYILHASGGTVLDLQGKPVPLDYRFGSLSDIAEAMGVRRKFVAAGTPELAQEIIECLR